MDSQAAVIKSEMMRTRADLDYKIARLEGRARELTPRRFAERHLPEHALDQALGGLLTLVGLRMAWKQVRQRYSRRARLRTVVVGYDAW